MSTFHEWTAAHRGDGVASLYATQFASNQEHYLKRFPNGINTSYRVVARTSRVRNPVTGAVAWSDNAAAVIRDYMSHKDGMRLPESLFNTPLAQAGWVAAFNRANENIAIKAGGTEKRYRLWGSYRLDERPADVVGRMLNCCDGRIVPTPDGGLTLDIGNWEEPSVIIDADAIVGFSDLGRGRDIMSTANTIRATFLDPSQDYQAADADPWVDETDVLERGEIAKDVQFNMAPSHSQARRLMKLEWFRANPSWVGTFTCNLRGLAAFGERFVRIQYPILGVNSVFEVQDFRFILGEGGIVRGVTLQVQSMPETTYQSDPSQEGTAPVSDHTEVDDTVPVPAPPTVAFGAGPVANLPFPSSPSGILNYRVRVKKTSDTITSALYASYNSRISAESAKCNNAGGDAVVANYGSTIEFSSREAKNAGGGGAVIRRGSALDAINADFSGAFGSNGVFVREGSTASLLGASCRKGASDVTGTCADIRIQLGGVISCNSSTAGGTSSSSNTVFLD